MSKGAMAMTTLIPIYLHLPDMHIFDWFPDPPPSLEGFALTVGTVLWAFFSFPLDIRQFQDHNRHGELLVPGDLPQSPSYKKLVLLSISQYPPLLLQSRLVVPVKSAMSEFKFSSLRLKTTFYKAYSFPARACTCSNLSDTYLKKITHNTTLL
jgi:hypothetical protein